MLVGEEILWICWVVCRGRFGAALGAWLKGVGDCGLGNLGLGLVDMGLGVGLERCRIVVIPEAGSTFICITRGALIRSFTGHVMFWNLTIPNICITYNLTLSVLITARTKVPLTLRELTPPEVISIEPARQSFAYSYAYAYTTPPAATLGAISSFIVQNINSVTPFTPILSNHLKTSSR